MRLPNLESFKPGQTIERKRISFVPQVERNIVIVSDREKLKVIKQIERIVRSSPEYREYVAYLKREMDMTHCAFFSGVSNAEGRKVSIEIHHEPFTLFDITQIIMEKHIMESERNIDLFDVAEEVMRVHYQNLVGLIPLSKTIHQLVHNGKIFIPLQQIHGRFIDFMQEYEPYIPDDIHSMLEEKIVTSKALDTEQDLSVLDKKYVYLDVDGFNLPHLIDEGYQKTGTNG